MNWYSRVSCWKNASAGSRSGSRASTRSSNMVGKVHHIRYGASSSSTSWSSASPNRPRPSKGHAISLSSYRQQRNRSLNHNGYSGCPGAN